VTPRIRTVELPDAHLQITELGSGTPVILCHGFPGLGYSFRHQLQAIADAGFHAVAPDMLGYGGSSRPADPARYEHGHITADLLALLDDLGADRAVFIGQDFGAPAAWNVALRAPQRVLGLGLLSVPYDPERLPGRPSELHAHVARDHFLHIHYFQEHGPADRELDSAPREFLQRLYFALSGGYRYLDVWAHPTADNGYLDVLPEAPPLPWSWLREDEFDRYVEAFTASGFTGGLNWYRAMDHNWELGEDFAGARIEVPTTFIAGTNEPVLQMFGEPAIDRMRAHIPDLRGLHLIEGAGHWVQQERPEEVNVHLIEFLRSL
jgi:pimeloyl-ACP methyl ester carboxylesterase